MQSTLERRSDLIAGSLSTNRLKRNWLIHQLYVRNEKKDCLAVIDQQLRDTNGNCEYPMYVKALIRRKEGKIQESLKLFEKATELNPHNISNLKQMGRSWYLLGKHKHALGVYKEADALGIEDWEIEHSRGLCYMHLKKYEEAAECFLNANSIQKHDKTFIMLASVYTQQENYREAIATYTEALEFSPENPKLLTTIGLLYLRIEENFKAFDFLGTSLAHEPTNTEAILAAGSIIQDHRDFDVALKFYRINAVKTPNSAELWNNIGMCFFGKEQHIVALSCLKRAMYLDPFEWLIAYNLGIVHLCTKQYASAFHYLSSSSLLKPDHAATFMYLGVTLSRLEDFGNSCVAYQKAIELEASYLFEINFAITLLLNGEVVGCREHFDEFQTMWNELDDEVKANDTDVAEKAKELEAALTRAETGEDA